MPSILTYCTVVVLLPALAVLAIRWRKQLLNIAGPAPPAAALQHWLLHSFAIGLPAVSSLNWRTGACCLLIALVKMATVPVDAFLGTHSRTRTPFAHLTAWGWVFIGCPCIAMLCYVGLRLPSWLMAVQLDSAEADCKRTIATKAAATIAMQTLCMRGVVAVLAASSWPVVGMAARKASGALDKWLLGQFPLFVMMVPLDYAIYNLNDTYCMFFFCMIQLPLDAMFKQSRWFGRSTSSLDIVLFECACVVALSWLIGLHVLGCIGLVSSMLAGVLLCPSRDQLRCWQWKARSWLHLTNVQQDRMICLFFETLPTDIQLLVLQIWLGNQDGHQLLALSALDMACSNHSLRQHFLHLLSHPSNRYGSSSNHLVPRCVFSYMHWLHGRQITVREIYLTAFNVRSIDLWLATKPLILPCIERIVIWEMPNMSRRCVESVMRMCPQVKSIEQELVPANLLGDANGGATFFPIWELIPWFPNHLASVAVCPEPAYEPQNLFFKIGLFMDDALLLSLGKRVGQHLQSLQVTFSTLNPVTNATVSILLRRFTGLCRLVIHGIKVTAPTHCWVQLVAGCLQLKELVLHNAPAVDPAHLLAAAKGHPSLRSVGLVESHHPLTLFAEMLEQHPWLNSLHLGEAHYCRYTAALTLQMRVLDSSSSILSRVLAACLPVRKLKLKTIFELLDEPMTSVIGQHIGSTLKELSITNIGLQSGGGGGNSLCAIIQQCPAVLSVELHGLYDALTDHTLQQMAMSWPRLECFKADANDSTDERGSKEFPFITDLGMDALFAGCAELKEVHLNHVPRLTFQTLQSIVEHKLHLRKLAVGKDIDSGGSASFNQMAKKQQLLPVPELSVVDWSAEPAAQVQLGRFILQN